MDKRAVSPVVGTILLIAITVALAAIVATLVSGLGGRGAPPSVMLTVSASNSGITDNGLLVTLRHEGGDDLQLKDIAVRAISGDVTMECNPVLTSGTFTVGGTQNVYAWKTITGGTVSTENNFNKDNIITVYVIHNPSKQKLFSSSNIKVGSTT